MLEVSKQQQLSQWSHDDKLKIRTIKKELLLTFQALRHSDDPTKDKQRLLFDQHVKLGLGHNDENNRSCFQSRIRRIGPLERSWFETLPRYVITVNHSLVRSRSKNR